MRKFKTDLFNYTHLSLDNPQPQEYHSHMHNGYELLFFMRGRCDYIIEDHIYKLRERDLLFIKATKFHQLKVNSSETYERISIHCNQAILPPNLLKHLDGFDDIYHLKKDSPLVFLFNYLLSAEYEQKVPYADMLNLIKASIDIILTHLKNLTNHDAPIHTENSLFSKILSFINQNLSNKITVEDLSRTFFVSISWIQHTFQNQLGITLKNYIDNKKMLSAQTMLNNGISPVKVAEALNYENYSTFYRTYIRNIGNIPQMDFVKKK